MFCVQVEKSLIFRREGSDIHSDVSISLAQAVLGGRLSAPGIYEDIQLSVSMKNEEVSVSQGLLLRTCHLLTDTGRYQLPYQDEAGWERYQESEQLRLW